MKATKIVYGLITILILIPIFVKRINRIREAMKSKDSSIAGRQFMYLIITCSIVLVLTISLHSFTIKYQAPLVAEQVNDIFVSCAREGASQIDFEDILYDRGLASILEDVEYDSILSLIEPQTSYEVYLSERTYKVGDNDVLYCKYEKGDELTYIEMGFKMPNNKWQLTTFNIADTEKIEEIDSKMKFFKIN